VDLSADHRVSLHSSHPVAASGTRLSLSLITGES
jgi:hypothetical protein